MKNICFISQCSLPIPTVKGGAVETLVEYLINENERKGHFYFTVVSVYDEEAFEKSKSYKYTKFIYVQKENEKRNKVLFFLYRILKHLGIYIPFSFEFKMAIAEIAKIREQDLFVFEAGPTTQLPALSKVIPPERLVVHIHWDGMGNKRKDKSFSYLLPVSEYIGKCWIQATGRNANKVKTLYNCANVELFSKKTSESERIQLKRDLSIPIENKVIIYTGRIVEEKGVKELLYAFQRLAMDNVSLLVIGSANFGAKTNTRYECEVEELINNCNKQIVFTGYVHQSNLYKYYNIANVAVMPSLFQDPAPLVGIEAQATGTPLICTRVGGIPEYVNQSSAILVDKDDNLVVNLSDSIKKVLNDVKLSEKMCRAATEQASRFSVEDYYNRFCIIVDEVINEQVESV